MPTPVNMSVPLIVVTIAIAISLLLSSAVAGITVTVVTLPQQQKTPSAASNFSLPAHMAPFYLPLRSEILQPQQSGSRRIKQSSMPCPSRCACSHTTVICTGHDLMAVPKGIPPGTTRLDLQENRISRIARRDFAGLVALKILQLMDNQIELIDEGAFTDLVNLERLQLSRNHLRSIPRHLFMSNAKLRRLDLSENYLSSVSDEHLEGLLDMLSLQLDQNQIRCMDHRRISSWKRLEVLTLNGNRLSTLGELGPFPAIRTMRLADNPWRCDCRLKWMKGLPPAFVANVNCNGPALLQGSPLLGISNKRLKCSGIEKRALGSCRGAIACPSACTCTRTTVDCRDRGLRRVPRSRDLPLTTRELRLEQNRITFIGRDAFQNLVNLTRLDLSKNGIRKIDEDAFRGLASLNTLMLFGNNLSELPTNVFSPLRHSLQLLLLNTNKLQCLQRDLFKGMERLALLSLYDNQIHHISDGTFNFSILETLHLAKNPLVCDCHLAWLEANLQRRQIETSGARCSTPGRLSRQRLGSIGADKFKCRRGAVALGNEGVLECVKSSPHGGACIANWPCLNNGTCSNNYEGVYKCYCQSGWHGEKCEVPIDACYDAPCLNNGTCSAKVAVEASEVMDGRFECHCADGFTGERCETNIDDCVDNKCHNGGTCIDQIDSYRCECPTDYSGENCERKMPYAMALSVNASQVEESNEGGCLKENCANGSCQYVRGGNKRSAGDDRGRCECAHGYGGASCDEQVAVGFKSPGSYLALAHWPASTSIPSSDVTKQQRNLTMVLRTTEKSGVIAYFGREEHYLAVELYAGRIKVAYYAGNYPPSHMYSHQTVDDGMPHGLQLIIEGKTVSMTLDSGSPQKVVNSGRFDNPLPKGEDQGGEVNYGQKRLYLGGLESSVARRALIGFHLKGAKSIEGCLSAIHLNGERVKLEDSSAVQKRGTLVGCIPIVDLCRGVTCSYRGKCVTNASISGGYRCSCQPNYHGPDCAQEEVRDTADQRCIKRKTVEHYMEGECRSIEPLKMGKCVGRCDLEARRKDGGNGSCCVPVKTKRRRVKLQCGDGRIRLAYVDVVRKCACEESNCTTATDVFRI